MVGIMAGFGWFFRIAIFLILATNVEAKKHSSTSSEIVAPYVMTQDHPIKTSLDKLFTSSRVTFNFNTLKDAGFSRATPRKSTKLVVTKNPYFPGYVFKLFLDVQRFFYDPEYSIWVDRIKTANQLKIEISARGLDSKFKVPNKWIYVLPASPKVESGYSAKHYILIAEDMDIFSDEENEALWKSDFVTHELLDDLYILVRDLGLRSCTKPENLPFSKDGTVAFIDTQFMHKSVDFNELTAFLSKENQAYWKSIISR